MRKKIRIRVFTLGMMKSCAPQLRFGGPFSYFPKDEYDFVYAPSLKALLGLSYVPDIIVFHRNAYPLKEIDKIISFAQSHNIATVIDMDDLITHIPHQHPSYTYYEEIKPAMIEIFKTVNYITVTNEGLKEHYSKYNPNVFVLPNLLDERIWNSKKKEDKADDDKIVIGYSGSPTHAYDFKPVIPAIKYILSKYSDKVCFKFMGYLPEEIRTMSGVYHTSTIDFYQLYANTLKSSRFSFAIAPLEDNIFNQCKSNIKFLEYSVCGYAGIYSAVGPYNDSVIHNETGLLIENTTDDWISAMELLVNNPMLRSKLGKNAYCHVKRKYFLKERAKEWYQAYNKIDFSQKRLFIKRFSLSPVISYGYYLIYAQLRNMYYKILTIFKKK